MHLAKCKKLRRSPLSAMTTALVRVGFFYTGTQLLAVKISKPLFFLR
jgi:hypothetical protein